MDNGVRWAMVSFFVLYGVWWIAVGRKVPTFTKIFCRIGIDDDERCERVADAVERRTRSEQPPSSAVGIGLGCGWLAMAALGAFSPLPITVLYATMTFATALTSAAAYLRRRHVERRRVAVLAVRDQSSGAPAWTWATVTVVTIMPLLWAGHALVSALLVTGAGIIISVLAGRVAVTSALLSGEDPAVETFVDERLRRVRSAFLLQLAVAPGFVFAALTGPFDPAPSIALLKSIVIWTDFTIVMLLMVRLFAVVSRRPSPIEVANW